MWKKALAATAALLITGSIVVLAQQAPQPESNIENKSKLQNTGIAELLIGLKLSADDMQAYSDTRLAALHVGLMLDVDQEKNWTAFEQAVHQLAKLRADSHATPPESDLSSDVVQQLRRQAHSLSIRSSGLEELADALGPLYQSLNDGQKRRFTNLARFMRRRPLHYGMGTFGNAEIATSRKD